MDKLRLTPATRPRASIEPLRVLAAPLRSSVMRFKILCLALIESSIVTAHGRAELIPVRPKPPE